MKYKKIKDSNYVLLLESLELPDEEVGIPDDPANRHYEEYLAWVAEGNTPDPADDE